MTTGLFDPCAAKHQGNAQSVAAFARCDAKGDRERIMALYANGARYTPKEIAAMLGKPLHTISGRFSSLKGGRLRPTGVVRDGSGELEATIKEGSNVS